MAPAENSLVFCACCQQWITVKAERTHGRAQLANPYPLPKLDPTQLSQKLDLGALLDADSDEDDRHSVDASMSIDSPISVSQIPEYNGEHPVLDVGQLFEDEPTDDLPIQEAVEVPYIPVHPRPYAATVEDGSDSEEEIDDEGIPIEDEEFDPDDDEMMDLVDWEELEKEMYVLENLDRTGEVYAVNAAKLGVFFLDIWSVFHL